jgi:hypothetical protein
MFLLGFTLLFSTLLVSQTKNEKEERIELKDFPQKAVDVLLALPKDCKRLKFYKETDGTKQSFEAKFKYNKQRYSLEFSNEGVIEDIEVTVKPKNIEDSVTTLIKSYFKRSYKRAKLIKTQKQYVYNESLNSVKFLNQVLSKSSSVEVNYEIIAEVKSKTERNIREFKFDKNGNFLNYKILNPDSYEHALY